MSRPETLILGGGFGGVTAAVRLAEEGHRVRCLTDDAPGASVHNFGQLHSGAVYAPVLPEVAAACWAHRSRWLPLLGADVSTIQGIGVFSESAEIAVYTKMWDQLDISVSRLSSTEISAREVFGGELPAAAFRLPDLSVDVTTLLAKTRRYAQEQGVLFSPADTYNLVGSGSSAVLWSPATGYNRAKSIVVAAGCRTPELLDRLGVEHPLSVRHLPYGVLPGGWSGIPLIYRLDGDRLAVSPQPDGLRVALPGRSEGPRDDAVQSYCLAQGLSRYWPSMPVERLRLCWGRVAEVNGPKPDPAVTVIDLAKPPPGWGRVDNLVVCLPGKWTTAWHAADQVVDALADRG